MDEEQEKQPEPLDREERENIQADLEDLRAMEGAFAGQGVKGVVVACPDCGSDHYYGWDLLKESLEHMLDTGEPRMHEPAFEPREEEYILWDYGKGYVDALADAGLDANGPVDLDACAWCQMPVEAYYAFCPKCGRATAPARLLRELIGRGMDERDARALLVKAGFEPFS
jgi:predicted RNA-binding Zn-ribbon protein involved in translation (DUF1610 family)